jgi:hypothetical protein
MGTSTMTGYLLTTAEQIGLSEAVLAVLKTVYGHDRAYFEQAAQRRGISLHQLAAVAVTELVLSRLCCVRETAVPSVEGSER